MNLKKKPGKVFTSKFVGTGPSSYKKRIYRAAVSQSLRNTAIFNGQAVEDEFLVAGAYETTVNNIRRVMSQKS